jgi:hypothetical protein
MENVNELKDEQAERKAKRNKTIREEWRSVLSVSSPDRQIGVDNG